jgi:hypothetical protein
MIGSAGTNFYRMTCVSSLDHPRYRSGSRFCEITEPPDFDSVA